jgi:CheY-like chemotaxis protein/HPt (histidine-containing phosphotransfer) domain-containing protein
VDPSLRELFEDEATRQLEGLEALLAHAADPAAAKRLARHAHTLKGSAAIVGLGTVARIAGQLEQLLQAVGHGRREVTPSLVEALAASVAELREVVRGSLAGEDLAWRAADLEHALAALERTGVAAPVAPVAPAPPAPPAAAPVPAGAGAGPDVQAVLAALAAAQLRTLELVAAQAGLRLDQVPEHAALAALVPAAAPTPGADAGGAAALAGSGAARRAGGLAPPVVATVAAAHAHRVLVVDDSAMIRQFHRGLLNEGGYDVVCARDGAEALAMLADPAIRAVVTDLEMPDVDGWALTRAIRTRPELAGIGVVVISSRGDEDARRRSAAAGADAHLVKGDTHPGSLLTSVAHVIGAPA